MEKSFVLFIVIQEHYKAKAVLAKLEEIGVPGATVVETMGAASLSIPTYNMYDLASPTIDLALTSNFNKTIFSVVPNEETVLLAMDEVAKILGMDDSATGKGIMFTVPLVGQMGLL
ncbi:MAG TPA: hypothetical protein GX707_20125 [Epulopiscium sp.]|nr:hypothetical protein [Candidatus Epulonipiscium sp.]